MNWSSLFINQQRNSNRLHTLFYTAKKVSKSLQVVFSNPSKCRCEECSMEKGTDVWLCNTVKTIDGVQTQIGCHMRYHAERKRNTDR